MTARKVLLISPIPTDPQTAGNRTRVGALLDAIKALGHEVCFLHVTQEAGDEHAMQARWGSTYHTTTYHWPKAPLWSRVRRKLLGRLSSDARHALDIDEWYDPGLDAVLAGLHREHRFETVICSYVFFSRALEVFGSDVFKIIDTHDAFANRHRQYLERGEKPDWFTTSERGERRAFGRADLVFAIQDNECQKFRRQTRTPVITLSHMTPQVTADPALEVGGSMLFVASRNVINQRGVEMFLADVMPGIRARVPNATLVLAGSICEVMDDHPGMVKLGRVDDLAPLYAAAALVINPVLFKTGLAIKSLEALGYGKALLTSSYGADGLEDGAGTAFLTADTPEAYIRSAVSCLTDAAFRSALTREAARYVRRRNESILAALDAAVSGCPDERRA